MASGLHVGRSLRQLTRGKKRTGGRNNTGRITSWHRGGGHKQSYRIIDFERDTPAMGVVERIEYDPNRTTRIALVRWKEIDPKKCDGIKGFKPPERKLGPVTTTVGASFAFATMPGHMRVGDRVSPGLKSVPEMIRIPSEKPSLAKKFLSEGEGSGKLTSVKAVFEAAFCPKSKKQSSGVSYGILPGIPRIAVAGAKSPFFVFGTKEEVGGRNTFSLSEIQRWKNDSDLWKERLDCKAAIPWHAVSTLNEELKMERGRYANAKHGMPRPGYTPVSYIIATHQMEVGSIVMNFEWTKPKTEEVLKKTNTTFS